MPKTQEELEQIFAPSVENEQELEVAQTPSAENKRKKLSKSVDTCVAETKKFNAVAPEISQSQLFTAIGSAIFNVFGNANLGSVSSAEKNTLEFLWWHALCMFGILCHKHEYEWKGDTDVQSFESLREKKKNGIKSGSNIIDRLKRFERLNVCVPFQFVSMLATQNKMDEQTKTPPPPPESSKQCKGINKSRNGQLAARCKSSKIHVNDDDYRSLEQQQQ